MWFFGLMVGFGVEVGASSRFSIEFSSSCEKPQIGDESSLWSTWAVTSHISHNLFCELGEGLNLPLNSSQTFIIKPHNYSIPHAASCKVVESPSQVVLEIQVPDLSHTEPLTRGLYLSWWLLLPCLVFDVRLSSPSELCPCLVD